MLARESIDHEDEDLAVCDNCRLEWPAWDIVVVEHTELEERWCGWCRDRQC